MSGKIQQIGVNSDSALKVFSKLRAHTLQTEKGMNDMGKSAGSILQSLSLLKNERTNLEMNMDLVRIRLHFYQTISFIFLLNQTTTETILPIDCRKTSFIFLKIILLIYCARKGKYKAGSLLFLAVDLITAFVHFYKLKTQGQAQT